MNPEADCVWVAITMDSGEPVRFMQFLTRGRGTILPEGAIWEGSGGNTGYWLRPPTAPTIAGEVARACPPMTDRGIRLPQPVSHRIVDYAEIQVLSPDRHFRDALIDDGQRLNHDMAKAKTLHRHRIRIARAAAFHPLDAAYRLAEETGNVSAKAAVAAQRQTLRDLPADPVIEAAVTVEDLRACWPKELK